MRWYKYDKYYPIYKEWINAKKEYSDKLPSIDAAATMGRIDSPYGNDKWDVDLSSNISEDQLKSFDKIVAHLISIHSQHLKSVKLIVFVKFFKS